MQARSCSSINPAIFDLNGTLKDKFKPVLRGEGNESELAQAIEDEVTGKPTDTVQEASVRREPAQDQGVVAESATTEDVQPVQPKRDPNLSVGATKVADYMDEAENATRNAIAAEVGIGCSRRLMAQDSATQAARKAYERAQDDLSQEQQKEIEISMQVDGKRQQMYGIYSAAMNEGVAFNSPNVQNAVIANQQTTAAFQSDLAKQQEKVKQAKVTFERAQNEYDEAMEYAKKRHRAEAERVKEEAIQRYSEYKRRQSEINERLALISGDESNEAKLEASILQYELDKTDAIYGDYEVVVALDGEILEGDLPSKQMKLLVAWMALHEDELKAN